VSAPDVIYFDGQVLTLDAADTRAQAVAVGGERIVGVGSSERMRALAGPATRVVDLDGQTLVPGFIDAHSHLSLGAQARFMADLNAPPIGKIDSIDAAVAELRRHAAGLPEDAWIVGFGYDDSLLAEHRHLRRDDLDRVSRSHPVVAIHVSGHLVAANTRALEIAGITRETPDPIGGVIRRDAATSEPDGVLEELPALLPVFTRMPQAPPEQRMAALEALGREYASRGVTTAQDGASGLQSIADLVAVLQAERFALRVVVLPTQDAIEPLLRGELDVGGLDRERLALGPVKLVADGSIQGFTGYLREPYHTPFRDDPDYRGYPGIARDELRKRVARIWGAGQDLAIHGNGDASIDDILHAFEAAQRVAPRDDARSIVIHAQMARDDQLDRMRGLGVSPSFFVLHTYYWGDRHRDLFIGPERARRISPTRSALQRGVRFSLHTDAPVVPMDVMRLVWSAVNRTTTGGQPLGPEQRLTPLEALRAVTRDAAWQYRLEDSRGSIEPGKLADLVILAENPLEHPERIHEIQVRETIVGGRSVYRASEHEAR
jgi:predicted amidohydrolase YtcJ